LVLGQPCPQRWCHCQKFSREFFLDKKINQLTI
jgi:hypothetical protein